MGKKLSYLDMAENDYLYLRDDFSRARFGNLLCVSSQNVCERYLKHIIDITPLECDATDVLRTHSLKVLRRFCKDNIPTFECNWNSVLLADGYYFSARYPGNDALITDEDDANNCRTAVEETRRAVLAYIDKQKVIEKKESIKDTECVVEALKGFSDDQNEYS